jgi:hypothetical protein
VPGSDFKLRSDLEDLEIVVTWMLNQCKEQRKVRTLNNRYQIYPNEQYGRMMAVKGAAAVDSVAAAGWAELCDQGKAAGIYVVPTGHVLQ